MFLLSIIYSENIIKLLNNIIIQKNFLYYKILSVFIYLIGSIFYIKNTEIKNFFLYSFVYTILFQVALVDKQEKIIPDKYNITLFIMGVLKNIYQKNFYFIIFTIFVNFGLMLILCIIEKSLKKDLLGGGDCKLLIALILLLGLKKCFLLFMFLEIILIFINKRKKYLELGYYIHMAYMAAFVCMW